MKNKKKFAVVLSGSGVYDGSEIHESTLTMLEIMKNGGEYDIFAPDIDQHHVINHITGEEMTETRNVLIESARIARGNIKDLKAFHSVEYDALIFPGGFGAAKNLSDFAFKGENCTVNPDVESAIRSMIKAEKPIGALCISPVLLAKILGKVQLTIGEDAGTAGAIESMGAVHQKTNHGEVVIDANYKIATTPCYMLDANILEISEGAENIVKAVIKLM